jgi:hypothetical protein
MQLSGSETSSTLDTSPPASSMSGRSKTSTRPICADSRSAISSPASASGRTPFALPAGLTTDLFGPVPVRANLSARQAKDLGLLTSDTSGRRGLTSSASVALSQSVASKLQAVMPSHGGTLFALTWKTRTTPAGRSISALRASGLRTSDSASTGWPTPARVDGTSNAESQESKTARGSGGINLTTAVSLASWPTPMAGTPAQNGNNAAGNTDYSRRVVELASWATPATRDWHSASGSPEFLAGRAEQTRGKPLSEQAFTLASWPTPTSSLADKGVRSTEGGIREAMRNKGPDLAAVSCLASGTPATGSAAETASAGQLNPAHSRWLMGLPPAWDDCAPMATRSSRRSRPPSSKQR